MHSLVAPSNDYRDILNLISSSYLNVTNLAIFGYGAKTSLYCKKASTMFPLSRNIRNPFIANSNQAIAEAYTTCVQSVDFSLPIHLNPTLQFFKSIGAHVKAKIQKKAKTMTAMRNTVDSVYVLYVLTTGLIDDVELCKRTLKENEWDSLPL